MTPFNKFMTHGIDIDMLIVQVIVVLWWLSSWSILETIIHEIFQE